MASAFVVCATAKQVYALPPREIDGVSALAVGCAFAAALLLASFALCLRGRAQIAALLVGDLVLTALHQVDLLYFRQFADLTSVAMLAFAWQVGEVRAAILPLLRPSDALLWLDIVALAGLLLAGGRVGAWAAPLRRARVRDLATVALLFYAAVGFGVWRYRFVRVFGLSESHLALASNLGLVGYHAVDAAALASRRMRPLLRSDAAARDAVAYHQAMRQSRGPGTGTERHRNVVVVQLESMQAFPIGTNVDGAPVTPAIDALASESVYFSRFFSQIGQGNTADAELLAGCSQYPSEVGAVFTSQYGSDFRCLPELLASVGYRTAVFHANDRRFWNRDLMYQAMGYGRFYAEDDFPGEPAIGMGLADGPFLAAVARELERLPQPFYAVAVTLSNHAPFSGANLPKVVRSEPGTLGAYLNSVHYMDDALGAFVARLRDDGLLERSILVVYGDHEGVTRAAVPKTSEERAFASLEFERRVPLLVRFPHGTRVEVRTDPAGQVDIAPTIADLLGIETADAFFHGRGLFSSAPRPVVLADGSAIDATRVFLSSARRFGAPGCYDGTTAAPLPADRCAGLATAANRALSVSRAEVEQDLVPLMLAHVRAHGTVRTTVVPGPVP